MLKSEASGCSYHQDLAMQFEFLQSYQDWRFCIEKSCRIELTKTFINMRIQELSDQSSEATQRFIQRYGLDHYKQIMAWFRQALAEL
jgi:hypothetical protein